MPPSARALALALALLWSRPARVSAQQQQVVYGLTPFDPFGILTLTMATPGAVVTGWSQVVYVTEWRPPLSGVGSWVEAQRIAMPSAGLPNPVPLPLTLQGIGLPTPSREGIGTTALDGQTAVFVGYSTYQQISNPQGNNGQRTIATVRPDGTVLLTQVTVSSLTVTRGAAAINGSASVYLATDTSLKFVDMTAATPAAVTVAALSRPYHPLFAAQGGGVYNFYTMGWSGTNGPTCNCNGLYGSGGPPPTTNVALSYQPATDRGGGSDGLPTSATPAGSVLPVVGHAGASSSDPNQLLTVHTVRLPPHTHANPPFAPANKK